MTGLLTSLCVLTAWFSCGLTACFSPSVEPCASPPGSPDPACGSGQVCGSDGLCHGSSTPELLVWLKLDDDLEDSNGAQDSSGHGNHAACGTMCPIQELDQSGGLAVSGFSVGSNISGLELRTVASVQLSSFTLSARVLRRGTTDDPILAKATRTGDSFRLQVHLVDRLNCGVVTQSGLKELSAPIANDVWVHTACTWDGKDLRLYQNGIPAGSIPAASPLSYTNDFPAVGCNREGRCFAGAIDDVRIYDAALTPTKIAEIAAP